MPENYQQNFTVRWADLDPNGHVRHSAYLDYGAQVRIAYLHEHGYSLARFQREQLGPVLFSEHIQYRKELSSNQQITADVALAGISENRKHWCLRHQVFNANNELAASMDCRGAWLDLQSRRVVPAPEQLFQALQRMRKTEDFTLIGSGR